MDKQPEALRLAGSIDDAYTYEYSGTDEWMTAAAYELERQHALIAELVDALQKIADLDSRPMLASEVIETARAALSKAKEQ